MSALGSVNLHFDPLSIDFSEFQHASPLISRRRHNERAPIASLMPEILGVIFLDVVGEDRFGLGAVALSHVCSCWRLVAIDYPKLWSSIGFVSVQSVIAMLDRSQQMPLELRLKSVKTDIGRTGILNTVPHLYRTRVLSIYVTDEILDSYLPMLRSSAPILEELAIEVWWRNNAHGIRKRLPDSLFQARTPKLHALRISYYRLDWTSPFFRGLSHLTTLSLRYYDASRQDSSSFISFLHTHNHLHTLELVNALPRTIDTMITLPNLITLKLLDHSDLCLGFLAHVRLAPRCSIEIECYADHMSTDALLDNIGCWSASNSGPDCELCFRASLRPDLLDLTISFTRDSQLSEQRNLITVNPPRNGVESADWMPKVSLLCRSLANSRLTNLAIVGWSSPRSSFSQEQWHLALLSLQNVRHLHLSGTAGRAMVTAMKEATYTDLRYMHTLEVIAVERFPIHYLRELLELVDRRRVQNLRLRKLRLAGCREATLHILAMLKDAVPVVEFVSSV